MSQYLIGILLALKIITLPVAVTTYGIDDQYFGRRHAASWHNMTPPGAPEVVDDEYYGAASNDLPIGAVVRITTRHECNGDFLDSARTVTVTVVDRMAEDVSGYIDLWPAPAYQVGLGRDDCALGEVR